MRGAIHNLTVKHLSAGTPDQEGRWTNVVASTTTVRGRLMVKTGREHEKIGKFAGDYDTVAVMPLTTVIAASDQVEASGISPQLDGNYEVMYVMSAGVLLEVYLRLRGTEQ